VWRGRGLLCTGLGFGDGGQVGRWVGNYLLPQYEVLLEKRNPNFGVFDQSPPT
jgi:hypothetical protein